MLHIVPIYDAKDWVSIAKHMGGDVTNEQCRNRYTDTHTVKSTTYNCTSHFFVLDYCLKR